MTSQRSRQIWPPSVSAFARLSIAVFLRLLLVSLFVLCLSGCPNKTPVAKAPPPPPPLPEPTATIRVDPATVQSGQLVMITWKTENATDVAISKIGSVQPNGSQTISPSESTSYHLIAKGAGGVREADARVTVVPQAPAQKTETFDETTFSAASNRLDVLFDFNDYAIRPDQVDTVRADAQFLKDHPDLRIVVEGHCDETGSTEFNLALGEKRAEEVKSALQKAGINASRIRIVSYGKEAPICAEDIEDCWKRNRRAHITPDTQQ
jgi:peptidoglycan-associated lipoprotein